MHYSAFSAKFLFIITIVWLLSCFDKHHLKLYISNQTFLLFKVSLVISNLWRQGVLIFVHNFCCSVFVHLIELSSSLLIFSSVLWIFFIFFMICNIFLQMNLSFAFFYYQNMHLFTNLIIFDESLMKAELSKISYKLHE